MWVGRVSDGSTVPRKFWPGCWGVPQPKSLLEGSCVLRGWFCISTLSTQGHWLGPPLGSLARMRWWPLVHVLPAADLNAHCHFRCTNPVGTPGGSGLGVPLPLLLQLVTQRVFIEILLCARHCTRPWEGICDPLLHGIHLQQWFSTRGQLCPQGTLSSVWRQF